MNGDTVRWQAVFQKQCKNGNANYNTVCRADTKTCHVDCVNNDQCVFVRDKGLSLEGYINPALDLLVQTCISREEKGQPTLGNLMIVNDNKWDTTIVDPSFSYEISPVTLPYSACGCTSDAQCRQSEKCIDRRCACQASNQCGPGRICSFFGYWYQERGNSDPIEGIESITLPPFNNVFKVPVYANHNFYQPFMRTVKDAGEFATSSRLIASLVFSADQTFATMVILVVTLAVVAVVVMAVVVVGFDSSRVSM